MPIERAAPWARTSTSTSPTACCGAEAIPSIRISSRPAPAQRLHQPELRHRVLDKLPGLAPSSDQPSDQRPLLDCGSRGDELAYAALPRPARALMTNLSSLSSRESLRAAGVCA